MTTHQTAGSTPNYLYGAPPIPTTSRRGRCAVCTRPITDGESARHVSPTNASYPGANTGPRPYQHTECPSV